MIRYVSALVFAVYVIAASSAQDKASSASAIEVRFADDSVVKMILQEASIVVVTRYGKLTVPASDIRQIEFGMRVSEETTRRIDAAIARLGAHNATERQAAVSELLALREQAFPALRRAATGNNADAARQATEIIRTLSETMPVERLQTPPHDTIVAAEFTITGRIETPTLKAQSPYFGETNLKLAELRSLRRASEPMNKMLTITVAQPGANDVWMDTGITVFNGTPLQIMASGSVELRASDGGVTRLSPNGDSSSRGLDRGGFGGRAAQQPQQFGGRAPRGGGFIPAASRVGALIGRIGEQGQPFVIGSRYEGSATEEGRLYLRIYPASEGELSGSYSVRLSIGR